MGSVQIIDTFPAFLDYWSSADGLDRDRQIDLWSSDYMARWPELRRKQINDYLDQGIDWQQIALEQVFPFINERLPAMKVAHTGLLENLSDLFDLARERLEFDVDIVAVIYVGLGNGAGWVTSYTNKPAILFGLENIAECQYESPPILWGLIAHELGHIAHFHFRAKNGLKDGMGSWWQLFIEGFAQRCEHVVLGQDLWHMKANISDGKWLKWCTENRGWLAAEYLYTVENKNPVNRFFGSWFDIRNRKQTGYYLGHEIIKEMETTHSLGQIALMDDHDFGMCSILQKFAAGQE